MPSRRRSRRLLRDTGRDAEPQRVLDRHVDLAHSLARDDDGEAPELVTHRQVDGDALVVDAAQVGEVLARQEPDLLETVGGSLRRVLPIILAHHDKFDGTGYHPLRGEEIPLEARIISVADVYDALTSDRPYRKAMAPIEAKEILLKGRGTDFDPRVIDAFLEALKRGEMEVASVML